MKGTYPRKPRAHPERELQIACVNVMLALVKPPPVGPAWTAVNPVPSKSKAVAGLSKAMGMRAGWPDFQMLFGARLITIEFKAPKNGSTSADQDDLMDQIRKAGGSTHVVKTMAEFMAVLEAEGIPHRKMRIQGGRA